MSADNATASLSYQPPKWASAAAQFFSYLLHPLFMPLLVAWIILYQHPINMLLTDGPLRLRIIAMVFINTLFFPGLVVFLLWRLKFLSSLHMESQRERIIPLTISIIFYFWAYYVGRNLEAIPPALQQWLLGIFIASSAAMFMNIFMKISLHTIGAGGVIMFFLFQMKNDAYWPLWWIIPVLLLAGLIGTARLLRSAHVPSEVYAGYLAGAMCQAAAAFIVS